MGQALLPIIGGIGALGQVNQARNAGRQQQGFNQLQQQQAMQQNQMFQGALPGYSQVLSFLAQRAGLGNFQMPSSMPQQQGPMNEQEMYKPFEIGGDQYHGLGSRLRGQGDPTVPIRGGRGNENSIADAPMPPPVPQVQDPPMQQYSRQFGSNKGTQYTREQGALTGMGDGNVKRMYGAGDPMDVNAQLQRRQQPGFGVLPQTSALQPDRGGLRPNAQLSPTPAPLNVNPTGGASQQQLGIWNDPADQFRIGQAQDDINRFQTQQQNQLRHRLAQRGMLNSGLYGSGEAAIANNSLDQFANFRRNLAIGAGGEEERRMMQFLQALAPAMGMSGPAAQTYSQLGQQAGQQQAGSNQALQGIMQVIGQLIGPQPGQQGWQGGGGRSNNYGGGFGGLG
jgi:hypothetical protein